MEKNCLVTKYKATVNDNSLLKIGEMRIGFAEEPRDGYRINFVEYPVVIETVDGSKSLTTDRTLQTGLTNKLTIPEDHYGFFTNNLNTKISIPNKYSVKGFFDNVKFDFKDLNCPAKLENIENVTCIGSLESLKETSIYRIWNITFEQTQNLSVLINFPALRIFSYAGVIKLIGNLSSISGLTNLEFFDVTNSYAVTGNLSSISRLTNLMSIGLSSTDVSGSIVELGGLIKLKSLGVRYTMISGEIIDFVLSQRSHGRTSGAITIYPNSNITFNGQVMNLEQIKISWTASTITNETTSETVNR